VQRLGPPAVKDHRYRARHCAAPGAGDDPRRMSETPRDAAPLPEAIEEAVLTILDGDESVRDAALLALFAAHPQHSRTLRAWLTSAGVTVPGATAHRTDPAGGATAFDALPHRLGDYVLHQLLGRGGFGTVYRAEQQEPIRRPVAVKVLNPGMDSREVLARFAAEREAMNRLDHPGIARLLDAGTTPQGRPFFVMELVEGPTLANLCRQQRLPIRARLALFLQVLDAIQHAHQKAVLHRDLSSNNVLVADPNGRAQPKVIDFGIAKSLSDPLLQGGAMTFQGTLMGTPEFMSPEQAQGRISDLDTRADVYALGVQLYELLTDQVPIPGVVLRSQGLAGMADVIARHAVLPPSQAAPKERRAELQGDLDAITEKAIAKARDERYATVAEFAADLRAHLADQPVQVASPTTWYRLRKFVRRNRAQSIAAAIAAIGLVAAFLVLAWALHIAREALAVAKAQTQQIAEKADAGFRMLANEERLRDAVAAAAALPAPWPEHEAEFAAWLARHGEPLTLELHKVRDKLATMSASLELSPGRRFADPVDQHLFAALGRLEHALGEFSAPAGPLEGVRDKLRFLQQVAAPAAREHAAAWQRIRTEVQRSDGRDGGTDYRGAQIPELAGLVPLGRHPRTGLFEFLDLRSHREPTRLPERDPATGDLVVGADTGIVFLLVPAGRFRMGAFRGEPGLPQNDPDAEDDELQGQLTNLDEFLLARTELTTGQWARLAGTAPEGDGSMPASGLDWHEALARLRQYDLDLPTEAQWEYACRAGTVTPWSTGDDPAAVAASGWFGARPQATGLLQGNAFGFHDQHGNVAEWCRDEYLPYGDCVPAVGDGLRQRPDTPTDARRVVRGGACFQGPLAARSAAREARSPTARDAAIGLRPIRLLRKR
jgi:serine/threonine protein kinase